MEEREVIIDIYNRESVNWEEEFNENKKFELDIGSGKGEFIAQMALKYSDVNYIGIEKSKGKCKKIFKKIKNYNLKNVKILFARVEYVVPQFFKEGMFEKIYINFPDPWVRYKRRKNRIIHQPGIMEDIVYILKDSGSIYFVTDVKNYMEETMKVFKNMGLKLVEYLKDSIPEYYPKTEFYYKTRSWNQPLFFARFVK